MNVRVPGSALLVRPLLWLVRLFGSKPDPAFMEAVEALRRSPEHSKPIERQELFRELRKAIGHAPQTRMELTQVEAELYMLGERIRKSPVCTEVPPIVWHFLSDAYIRFKSAEYGSSQCQAVEDAINHWEPAR